MYIKIYKLKNPNNNVVVISREKTKSYKKKRKINNQNYTDYHAGNKVGIES